MSRPDHSVAVVIPAAGAGLRLGGMKKQFRLLGGKPLLVQTVLRFQNHPEVGAVAIAAPPEELNEVAEMCREHALTKVSWIVAGGSTRQASVRAGLASIDRSFERVLTHDAVRPFVSSKEIRTLLDALDVHRAVALAAPVTDTLCRAQSDLVEERVDREGVFRLLTPQAFHRDVLDRAHDTAVKEDGVYTDEVTLVKGIGVAVALVSGSGLNLKITTPADWELAEWMWPVWEGRETLDAKR